MAPINQLLIPLLNLKSNADRQGGMAGLFSSGGRGKEPHSPGKLGPQRKEWSNRGSEQEDSTTFTYLLSYYLKH